MRVMPLYDCGDRDCDECQRAFGPKRDKAIKNFEVREAYYAALQTETSVECERCKGSGITGHRLSGTYVGPGPVPEDARGFYEARCEECRGSGSQTERAA
jgi:hypothetical protein